MDDLTELYQEIILEHNKHPRNTGVLENPTCSAEGYNPLCGDEVTVYVNIEDNKLIDICFTCQGCAISKASASLMTLALKHKSLNEAKSAVKQLCNLLTNPEEPTAEQLEQLGDLAALSGVRRFYARIKCATLVWHTLEDALKNKANKTL
jgi:nitrogen fixation NifU-like protein